jgi:5,6-dimethylbenzimidazole synthase
MPTPATSLYDIVQRRRDVRAEFTGEPADPEILQRILGAAHAAPSVGMTQPWDFILMDDPATKQRFWEHVQGERGIFADKLDSSRVEVFAAIKVEGILDASLSMVVTYDPQRGAPDVLGRHAIADAGLYSTCLAIQNLWLAATAEGWGVGWVSFYREAFLAELVGLPPGVRPVAWLCLGPVHHLQEIPDLERAGWRQRRPLSEAIHHNRWGQ